MYLRGRNASVMPQDRASEPNRWVSADPPARCRAAGISLVACGLLGRGIRRYFVALTGRLTLTRSPRCGLASPPQAGSSCVLHGFRLFLRSGRYLRRQCRLLSPEWSHGTGSRCTARRGCCARRGPRAGVRERRGARGIRCSRARGDGGRGIDPAAGRGVLGRGDGRGARAIGGSAR